jgi:hypothetical protein
MLLLACICYIIRITIQVILKWELCSIFSIDKPFISVDSKKGVVESCQGDNI